MKLNLKNAKRVNTIKGFGASACWWSPQVEDEKTAEKLSELLYGDNGLALNIYRYNVGGGYRKGDLRIGNPWRKTDSFMKEDNSYNWNNDKNAVRVMKKCLDKGNVDTLIFFANSPHFTQTVTGQTSGGFTEHFSNLDKSKYDEFAKYFIDIAEHFIKEGYPVKYISPINEPQWKWGGEYVWQEGCHYEPEEVRDCFLAFAKELEKRKSPLLLYGPESGNISDTTKEYYKLLSKEPLIMKYLDTFAYHSYGSDNNLKNKEDFGKWAKKNIKTPRFDMSEWCELPCKSPVDSIDGALITARVIGEDLIYTGVDSWSAWVCVNQWDIAKKDGKCYSDGLLYAKDDFSDFKIAMRYYAVKHFSKYIPVGSVSLNTGYKTSRKLSVFPFRRTDGKTVIVAVNDSNMKRVIETDLKSEKYTIITTDQNKQMVKSVENGKIIINPKTILTIIFE